MLQQEKIEQAVSILKELNIPAWLIFARETEEIPERSWELLAPAGVVWQSAILLTAAGERIAIVGQGDDESYRRSGLYTEVHSYTQGMRDLLRSSLARLNPARIAINYSENNAAADGLTHGMFLMLQGYLSGTPFADRLISADPVISRLRGRKTDEEVKRVRAAAAHTAELFSEATLFIRPGLTERAIAKFFHARMEEWKVQPAWELAGCPIVNAGPESEPGHAAPGDLVLRPGQILHVDFGIKENEYCSDLQRIWYVLRPGEKEAPAEIQRAVDAVVRTIQEGARLLRPGVAGWQVDARAREVITGAGYPEYQHALGHQLGRTVHDGSTLLGPHWERYGDTPDGIVEENQIYTLELGAATSAGFVGLEEDVLVTASGIEWLSTPQTAPFLVGGG